MKKNLCFALAVWLLAPSGASGAPDCAAPVSVAAPLEGPLQPASRVKDLRVTLRDCRRQDRAEVLAIRTLSVDGEDLLLAVDPEKLTTRLERAACWTCAPTTPDAQSQTRFLRAVQGYSNAPGKKLPAGATWFDNAGLIHGRSGGAFLTGDLCPSHRPLDRAFLTSLEGGGGTPIALAISGLWIRQHADDFLWLRREKAEKRLDIAFVNHSDRHPYRPGLPDAHNYLLMRGVDMRQEIFEVERLLIANGEVPSVFFRFPGLISDRATMDAVRDAFLIPLGAQSWLALTPVAPPAAVVLVHPNGNEPFGLKVFEHLRHAGRLPAPYRPISEAP
ncbi:polysaccharide deacetylase [Rhodoblastus sp.]|uniref:polysaccharide deacetylase n=1 Tax=Rhodoblastus sp. TaxID=1962975 RepID=UPI0026099A08|nr:polysaccharide deacetylase [Rhodoblastus sp.]